MQNRLTPNHPGAAKIAAKLVRFGKKSTALELNETAQRGCSNDATQPNQPCRRHAVDGIAHSAILFNLSQSHGEDVAELAFLRARVRDLLFRFVLIPPIGPSGCASWRALP
ncbi:hypothetical protein [Paraeggerthella hongkongensis]|uniref:hypothetical protein n=1 Tax=Paraeggerthella hongkongensis TaxID=230658 RepID=UPI001374C9DF|nr:hypothetical protein [Paraeggerthella hongkongensis]